MATSIAAVNPEETCAVMVPDRRARVYEPLL